MAEPVNRDQNKSEYIECAVCESLWQIGYPLFLVVGLFGNALCLVAFTAQKLRRETRVLCSLCAALDSLSIAFAFVSRWPELTFGISSMNPAVCGVLTTANYWLPEVAGWTLAYLSLERFLSVCGYRLLARVRWSVLIICSISSVLLVINVYFIVFRESEFFAYNERTLLNIENTKEETAPKVIANELNESSPIHFLSLMLRNLTHATGSSPNRADMNSQETVVRRMLSESSGCVEAFEGSHWALWNLVDLALSSLGPFVFICAFNAAVVLQIVRKRRHRHRPRPLLIPQAFHEQLRLNNGAIVALEGDRQLETDLFSADRKWKKSAQTARDSGIERSVTLMLLVATFLFLVMRTPIAMGHALQMLLGEEEMFEFVGPITCMTAFAVAEMLAFIQHTTQFYIYYTCSRQFRLALRKQLGLLVARYKSLVNRIINYIRSANEQEPGNVIHLRPRFSLNRSRFLFSSTRHAPELPINCSERTPQCNHSFIWTEQHVLLCYRCLYERVVHHPSCPFYREGRRFDCECLSTSIEHPAHIVVHLSDLQNPYFGS